MKNFNTLKELWEYSLYCPVCKEANRTINISIGPDNLYKYISFKKENDILQIECTYRQRKQDLFKAFYNINLLSNTFYVDLIDLNDTSNLEMNVDANLEEEEKDRLRYKIRKSYFYFYINADCRECNISYISSADIQLSPVIYNIGVEREGIYIISTKDKYHLTIYYDGNKTLINKVSIDKESFELIDDSKTFECNIVNFDFSDFKKTINKIKTYINFS